MNAVSAPSQRKLLCPTAVTGLPVSYLEKGHIPSSLGKLPSCPGSPDPRETLLLPTPAWDKPCPFQTPDNHPRANTISHTQTPQPAAARQWRPSPGRPLLALRRAPFPFRTPPEAAPFPPGSSGLPKPGANPSRSSSAPHEPHRPRGGGQHSQARPRV